MACDPLVYVIDDDDAMRDSLDFLLTTAGFVPRLYETASRFLEALPDLPAGCVLTDVRMPGIGGIELLRRIKESGRGFPVIVMTGHGDVPLAVEAMKLGAADFVEKPFDDEQLVDSIRAALETSAQARETDAVRLDIAERMAGLSQRERQVLDGLVAGHANKVIAKDLDISPRTVEIYRANVMTKMRAASLSELVRLAMLAGLTRDG